MEMFLSPVTESTFPGNQKHRADLAAHTFSNDFFRELSICRQPDFWRKNVPVTRFTGYHFTSVSSENIVFFLSTHLADTAITTVTVYALRFKKFNKKAGEWLGLFRNPKN